MEPSALLTLLITLIAAVLLISDRVRADLMGLIIMVVLGLSGLVTPAETFAGFSGSAVMTILGISIISEGLRQTGVALWLGNWMRRLGGKNEIRLILVTMLVAAGLSLFMNNIAVVGVLFPATMAVARRTRVPAGKLLMPLAYGTALGGMATLLTTSNIVVSGMLKDNGLEPFGLLDFLPLGLPVVAVGVLYMLLWGRRLLPAAPNRGEQQQEQLNQRLETLYNLRNTISEVRVLAGCPLAGMRLADMGWALQTRTTILGILRNGQAILAPGPEETLQVGDRLFVQGQISAEIMEAQCLQREVHSAEPSLVSNENITLAELVISPHSSLIGRTLKEIRFRDKYHLNVVAVWRSGDAISSGLSDLKLRFGDALLVQGLASVIHAMTDHSDLLLLEENPDAVLKPGKLWLALAIMVVTLGIATLGYLPVAQVVLAGAVLMLLTGCLTMNDVYKNLEWKAIFLIAGMWPLSTAIMSTGLADAVGVALIQHLGFAAPWVIAAVLIGVGLLLTQVMSGQVAALVIGPLALAAASQLQVDPRAMAMGVALSCSLSFPTPLGHPVNLMVMGSGGYRFRDFLRIGTPLTILIVGIILAGLILYWGI
ncbi:MAG TPA: SLC13 family permease [Anaerolineaceae bacterium]|nr:SLC13 family permease [Anaerolineaceae bacterium]HQH34311.1 SLC13 family permease [Anaerolineaceae bacterium]